MSQLVWVIHFWRQLDHTVKSDQQPVRCFLRCTQRFENLNLKLKLF